MILEIMIVGNIIFMIIFIHLGRQALKFDKSVAVVLFVMAAACVLLVISTYLMYTSST